MIRKEDMNTLKPYKHIFTALQNNERDGLAGIREELDDILDLANGQSGGSRISAIKLLRRYFGEKRFKLREYSEVVSRYCKLMDYMNRLRWLHEELKVKEKKFSYDKGIKMNRIRLTKLIKRHENNLKWFPSHIDLKFMNHLCQKYNLHTFGYKKNKIRGYHV